MYNIVVHDLSSLKVSLGLAICIILYLLQLACLSTGACLQLYQAQHGQKPSLFSIILLIAGAALLMLQCVVCLIVPFGAFPGLFALAIITLSLGWWPFMVQQFNKADESKKSREEISDLLVKNEE